MAASGGQRSAATARIRENIAEAAKAADDFLLVAACEAYFDAGGQFY
jgi:hypothetical protein